MIFSFFHPTPCTPHLPQAKDGTAVLIWGGSTAVGFAAIQLAKAMGCKVYTTCSAKNVAQLEAAGADVVVDYRKEGALDELKAAAKAIGNDELYLKFAQGQKLITRDIVYAASLYVEG